MLRVGLVVAVLAFQAATSPVRVTVESPVNEADALLLETVQLLGVRANAECERLDAMTQYTTQRTRVQKFIEKTRPGLTVDWSRLPARIVPVTQ